MEKNVVCVFACVTESLCCVPETNTTLQKNHASKKKKKKPNIKLT